MQSNSINTSPILFFFFFVCLFDYVCCCVSPLPYFLKDESVLIHEVNKLILQFVCVNSCGCGNYCKSLHMHVASVEVSGTKGQNWKTLVMAAL